MSASLTTEAPHLPAVADAADPLPALASFCCRACCAATACTCGTVRMWMRSTPTRVSLGKYDTVLQGVVECECWLCPLAESVDEVNANPCELRSVVGT